MLLYSDLTYAINGAAFHVYNKLGHGFLEAVYQEALEIEFQRRNIPYEREKELKITYDGVELKQTYKADFVCYGKIIVELKAVSALYADRDWIFASFLWLAERIWSFIR